MDASGMLSLAPAAQLERERQVLRGYDEQHDAGHTGREWLALIQQRVDQIQYRTERELEMQNQYGDVKDWPDGVLDAYD